MSVGSVAEDIKLYSNPAMWSKVASKLKPLMHVEVVDDDERYFCEYIVLRSDNVYGVVLRPLRGIQLDGVGAPDMVARDKTGMSAVYKGPALKWCVMRGEDVLSDRHQTEAAAFAWINTQTRAHAKDAA
jgi:hypothetical protein